MSLFSRVLDRIEARNTATNVPLNITNYNDTASAAYKFLFSLCEEIEATVVGLQYQGTWSAAGHTYPSSTPTKGQFWIISVAGYIPTLPAGIWYAIGDWIIYNGSTWQRVHFADEGILWAVPQAGEPSDTHPNILDGEMAIFGLSADMKTLKTKVKVGGDIVKGRIAIGDDSASTFPDDT